MVAGLVASAVGAGPVLLPAVAGTEASAAQAAPRYVALGDSYASGEGAKPFDGLRGCHQSKIAGARQFARQAGLDISFQACTGGKMADVRAKQLAAVTPDTKLVTISIGGNDIGFSNVLKACAGDPDVKCDGHPVWKAAQRKLDELGLPDSSGRNPLQRLYGDILARAPQARLMVQGYPRLFKFQPGLKPCQGYSAHNQRWMNDMAIRANVLIRRSALSVGATYVDLAEPFREHGNCTPDPWINGWVARHLNSSSFHPNARGQAGIARALTAAYVTPHLGRPSIYSDCPIEHADRSVHTTDGGRLVWCARRDSGEEFFWVPIPTRVAEADPRGPVTYTSCGIESADRAVRDSTDGRKVWCARRWFGDAFHWEPTPRRYAEADPRGPVTYTSCGIESADRAVRDSTDGRKVWCARRWFGDAFHWEPTPRRYAEADPRGPVTYTSCTFSLADRVSRASTDGRKVRCDLRPSSTESWWFPVTAWSAFP